MSHNRITIMHHIVSPVRRHTADETPPENESDLEMEEEDEDDGDEEKWRVPNLLALVTAA
jgi:hypothetical protein